MVCSILILIFTWYILCSVAMEFAMESSDAVGYLQDWSHERRDIVEAAMHLAKETRVTSEFHSRNCLRCVSHHHTAAASCFNLHPLA